MTRPTRRALSRSLSPSSLPLVLGLMLAATTGCSGGESATPTEPVELTPVDRPPELPAEPPAGPHAHMQQHMEAVTKARDAVILGDIDEAKGPMGWLAEHHPPEEQLPRGWQAYIRAMQGHAAAAAQAQTVPEVAEQVALTARECGACHTAMGARPTFADEPVPGGEGVKRHMARHQWAADRMWEGLIAPDGDRWRSGAMTMLEDPLHELSLPGTSPVPGAVGSLGEELHALGEAGLGTVEEAKQAQLYGQSIAACGTCHSVTGGGPKAAAEEAPAAGGSSE